MDLKDLENLIVLLKQNDISEFELEHDGMKVKLQRGVFASATASAPRTLEFAVPQVPVSSANLSNGLPSAIGAQPATSMAPAPGVLEVKSPIVGTFYRKPSPDADPFVKEGDLVKKGDTLCIIEAMKLMNEIEAPSDGKIEKIILSDSKVVEYGEVLFLLNTSL